MRLATWTLATAWVALLCITSTTSQGTNGCSGAYTAYFVVDGSESISNSSFEEIRNALITFANQSIRSNSLTEVGVVLYSDYVTAVINASSDINSLVNAIRMLAHPNSGTFTHLGIRRAKGLLDVDTSGNPHIMIVMTDGLSNYPADTKAAAAETKNSGIRVFAVGVNPLLNFPSSPYKRRYEQELVDIASDNSTAIQIEDFSSLVPTVQGIVQSLCRRVNVDGGLTPWTEWSGSACIQTCGPSFTRTVTRVKTCTNPTPLNGGRDCSLLGSTFEAETRSCNLPNCPINGGITPWTQWSNPPCPRTCGSLATKAVTRRRTCTNPNPAFGGADCPEQNRYESRSTSCLLPDCGVNGTFTQWGPWDNPACGATCGQAATKTVRRTRICLPPQFGGLNCLGPLTETQEVSCGLGACPNASQHLCDNVQLQNDVGYRYHPSDCDKYVQCFFNPSGNVIGVYRSCPFGFYWNQVTFQCDESWKVSCPLERCTGSCAASYKLEGSCRSYWLCDGMKSVAKCCPQGFSFFPGHGCRANYYCDDVCPNTYSCREVCQKRPDWTGAAGIFNTFVESIGWKSGSCRSGTVFDIAECGCIDQRGCAITHDLDSRTPVSWLRATNVSINSGIATLVSTSRMYLDIKMTINTPVSVKFRFREAQAVSGRRILMSSSDCKKGNSLLITVEDQGIRFSVWSWYGDVTNVTIFTQGMSRSDWKTVSVGYNGRELSGVVESGRLTYMSKVMASNANIMECGLQVGGDNSPNTSAAFVGSIDTLQVSRCNPGLAP